MVIIEEIKKMATPIVNELGCELCDVTYAKEGKDYYLRLFVDKVGGKIDLDLIVKISEQLSLVLDDNDIIDTNYVLDISSLGAERPIEVKNLKQYLHDYIHIHLCNPYLGMNDLEGDVDSVDDDKITLLYRDKTRIKKAEIKLNDIDRARLAVKF